MHPPAIIATAGSNYLAAIETPFSVILFCEVLILISALPQSTTRSITTQFEIVSLIFIRGFFEDISAVDREHLRLPANELLPALLDVSAGLLMFLLVSRFSTRSVTDAYSTFGRSCGGALVICWAEEAGIADSNGTLHLVSRGAYLA